MKKAILLIQILGILFLSNQVFAAYVDLSEDSWEATFFSFDFNNDGVFSTDLQSDPISGDSENDDSRYAGQFNVDFLTGIGGASLYTTTGFCIDLTTRYANGDAIPTGLSGLNNWQGVVRLLDTYWLDTNDSFMNAALQMAVWHTIYDETNSSGTERFAMSTYGATTNYLDFATTRTHYEDFIDETTWVIPTGVEYQILHLTDNQDIIIKNPVPVPSTMLLFGSGFLVISIVGRKKRV